MSKTKKDIENLFELSPEALFLEDSEGKVLDVNQEACEMLSSRKSASGDNSNRFSMSFFVLDI